MQTSALDREMIHTDSAASETDFSATNATGQSVSLLLRIFVLLAIWSAFSVICYMNYQTDACPPEVKHREALLASVTAPLFLAAHTTATCFHTPYWLKQVFAWGFLIGFVALAIALLRSASRRWFILSAVALIALLCGGTWCLVYANAHAYP